MISTLKSALEKNLIFVHGKGGVGKTVISRGIAEGLAAKGKNTLWVTIESRSVDDSGESNEPGSKIQLDPHLTWLDCDATAAFEEYVGLKIGMRTLTRIFIKNRLIQYLTRAAPGIHELMLLGKIWHECEKYDHLVVDLPSTGHGVAMFQSIVNFKQLFNSGPIHADTIHMLDTFSDSTMCSHLIVALPEEMPVQESLDLKKLLLKLFPVNPPVFLINKVFPGTLNQSFKSSDHTGKNNKIDWSNPLPSSTEDYVIKRMIREYQHLQTLKDSSIEFESVPFASPLLSENQLFAFVTQSLEKSAAL